MKTIQIIDHIVRWLTEYAVQNKTNGFVVGISGGIDSALTSTLCAKTGLPTAVVSMPIHQAISEEKRALAHIEWLKNKFENVADFEVDLTTTFDTFKNSLPKSTRDQLSMANSRARIRMTTLYAFAGNMHYLVAGTGNKVEDFGVGFYTKYGDGGVDLSPIADLMKSEVRLCSKALGINSDILLAKPTDGLWGDDRSDEDQLGASYDELEWAMEFNGNNVSLSDREKEVLAIYRHLNQANQHKMLEIPVCKIPSSLK
ncbi:MAG: NAD(+) synthase [Crocinitomicaceae bacterium]|nr:NAD(+) synthase [Crocinitomicaceae bacterium]